MSYVIRLALLLGLLPALPAGANAQRPDPAFISNARSAVGLVIASQCTDGRERSGTGFVWPQADQLVTARHVVAGCGHIVVQFPGGQTLAATPLREIRVRDLIALRLDSNAGAQVQTVTEAPPPIHSEVAVVGYALGAPTADDKLLTVTTGNNPPPARLQDMLPFPVRQKIANNGPWDLQTAILRLDGNLTHGHSGAPVFDHQGQVVAIGAGGLESGATGIVWAVSAAYLTDPANWSGISTGGTVAPESGLAFSVQPPRTQVEQVDCGGFTLTLSRTSVYQDIAATVDDPAGLMKVQTAVGFGLPINFAALRFDIWEDLQSGAVIPLPQGTQIKRANIGCTADVGNGITIWIRAFDGSGQPFNTTQANAFSIQLEQDVITALGPLAPDPQFTYTYPIIRPDGLLANRKGALGPQIQTGQSTAYQNYGFITHVTRGGYYLGVAALREKSEVDYGQINQCAMTGNPGICNEAIAPMRTWAAAALSVHMTTMPPI